MEILSTHRVAIADLLTKELSTDIIAMLNDALNNGYSFADVVGMMDEAGYKVLIEPIREEEDDDLEMEKATPESFDPPAGVQAAAKRASEWVKDGFAGDGFTDVGRARMGQLANGTAISLETIKKMNAFFARHGVNRSEHWDLVEGEPTAWRVAWDAWGGDAGRTWVTKLYSQYDITKDAEKAATPPHVFEESEGGHCSVCAQKSDNWRHLVKDAGAEAVISKAIGEKRYTLAPMYVPNTLDAHGEWTDPDELQNAVWNYVRSGDRRIRLQHNRDIVAGEWVEVMQIPYPMNVPMYKGDGSIEERTYPAGTVFLGVIWEPWAWEAVKNGTLSGYSIGGRTERVLEEMPMDKAQSRDRLGRFSSTGGGGAASAPAGGGGAAGGGAKMTAAQEKSMNAATDTVISSYSSARTSGSVDVQEKMRSAVDTHNKAVESLKAGDKAAASKHSLSTMKLMMSAAASPMLTSTNRVTMESSAQRYSELMTRAIG